MNKTVVSANEVRPVPSESVLTYTVMLSNTGDVDALGARLIDTLLSGLTFAGWVQQPQGAERERDNQRLTWRGGISPQTSVSLVYTVTVAGSAAGQTLTNTVQAQAIDLGSIFDAVGVTIQGNSEDQIFLPLVLK